MKTKDQNMLAGAAVWLCDSYVLYCSWVCKILNELNLCLNEQYRNFPLYFFFSQAVLFYHSAVLTKDLMA